jgi:flagellin
MSALKYGESVNIGSKGYTIGSTLDTAKAAAGNVTVGSTLTINGTTYTIVEDGKTNADDNEYSQTDIQNIIKDNDKVVAGTQTYVVMGTVKDGVSASDASVISAEKAYSLITSELKSASSIGTDAGKEASVSLKTANADVYSKTQTQVSFQIKEGSVETTQGLQMGLHVGADADGTNKITFKVDNMSSAGLGIKNLNLVDSTGAKATYAIDAISDAISKVSAQRSSLGAVQNRLEHTINNLDNVVENTTSAESQIRDTDMAEEMVEYSKNNILAQAGQSMLAQANQSNQGVLSLLG